MKLQSSCLLGLQSFEGFIRAERCVSKISYSWLLEEGFDSLPCGLP